MAQGLQVFDANGKVVVNMQTRISKILGKVTIDWRSGASGSLTDARLLDGTMWYAVTQIVDLGDYATLEVRANGSTLSWTQKFNSVGGQSLDTPSSIAFIYGIY